MRCLYGWVIIAIVVAILVVSCADRAKFTVAEGTGPDPKLPTPVAPWIPTVRIASPKPWLPGQVPTAAQGLRVTAFASNLEHPRWLHVLPNGDVLVAETGAPDRPDDGHGLRGIAYRFFLRLSGAAVIPANRITLLRDTDGDGNADARSTFVSGLNSPFGMALVGSDFYVANTDSVVRFKYIEGQPWVSDGGKKVADLMAGSCNHHWTRGLVASLDGSKLYVSIGANSDHGEDDDDEETGKKGRCPEKGRAQIVEIDVATGELKTFASGLRNPVGMAWVPESRTLWTAVNERDELGSDMVPDYMTSVERGDFYGWPYYYFGNRPDTRVKKVSPVPGKDVKVPKYALGPHTASLGLEWAAGQKLGPRFERGMFIGQHGSWNRKPRSGYKVIFVPFGKTEPSRDPPVDVLWGFLDENEKARGRPVGVAIDKRGGLLVADDVGGVVWRVSASGN